MAAEAAAPDGPQEETGGQLVAFNVKFEGQRIVEHRVKFSGNLVLGDPDLVKALKLNDEVTLVVKGHVDGRNHKMKNGKDGGRSGAGSSSAFVIESVALDESTAA
jgi:hypothetical protein